MVVGQTEIVDVVYELPLTESIVLLSVSSNDSQSRQKSQAHTDDPRILIHYGMV